MNREEFPYPCRNAFESLRKEDPDKLIRWITSGLLEAYDLTFAAEELGYLDSSLSVLIKLLEHESSLVREGAILGLNKLTCRINDLFNYHANMDTSPGVRHVAYNCWSK